MRKREAPLFAALFALLICAFALFYGSGGSAVFELADKLAQETAVPGKVILVKGISGLYHYNAFVNKVMETRNTSAIFMPPVLSEKPGDYIRTADADTVKSTLAMYKDFTILLAEASNVVPVIYPSKETGAGLKELSGFAYVKQGKKSRFPAALSADAAGTKLLYSLNNPGYYAPENRAGGSLPAFYLVGDALVPSPPVEAVRKFFGFTKNQVKPSGKVVAMGSVISFPVSGRGRVFFRDFKSEPREYKAQEFFTAPAEELSDKVIVAYGSGTGPKEARLMARSAASIMQNRALDPSLPVNLAAAAVMLAAALPLVFGAGALLSSAAAVILLAAYFFLSVMLLKWSILLDVYAAGAILLSLLGAARFSSLAGRLTETAARKRLLKPFTIRETAALYVSSKKDLRMINSVFTARVARFFLECGGSGAGEKFKAYYEAITGEIYVREKEFLAVPSSFNELAVIFTSEQTADRQLVECLVSLREKLGAASYNAALYETAAGICEHNGTLVISACEPSVDAQVSLMEKRGYLAVRESEIQKYVNITKFQKIAGREGEALFNIAGIREA